MVLRPPFSTLSRDKCIIFVNMVQTQNIIISNYASKTAKTNNEIYLMDELYRIKNGHVKSQIEKCRWLLSQGLKEEYNILKATLPGVTFGGKFTGSHKAENLVHYSNLMIIDFDGLDIKEILEKKKQIFEDKHVFAIWVSPSNLGLKVLLKTDSTVDTHKIYFNEICRYLSNNFQIYPDKSGSDTCRICFTSYDPEILIKDECVPFSVDLSKAVTELKINKAKLQATPVVTDEKIDKILFYATEDRNSKRDRETIDKIIKFLKNRKLSITSTYNDWYRVGLAIANTFTYELGKKYYLYLCELDGISHDEYKSINLLDYCYRNRKIKEVNFSTIIYLAEQQGFENKLRSLQSSN